MSFDSLKGSLKVLKGQIKQKWAKLTDDDLNYVEGNVDELVGRIQKNYGEKKEDIKNYIDSLKAKHLYNRQDDHQDEASEFGTVGERYKNDKSNTTNHNSNREL